ncbi:AI-2E family transporter [Falsiroseomonas sp. HW251]|uniref:AI-2E family transporter n=1 Tax=Falsiroseomonas sp. HW251 TaxID=3390998 RepID=UPI003D3129C0
MGSILRPVANFGVIVVDLLTSLVLPVVVGAFLAADPGLYRRGLVKLFPKAQHDRIDDALLASGHALRAWLLATLLAMAIVGTLAGLGSWALGLPAPLAIGLFAGLTEFVPVIGPIAGAVPALLLSLGLGGYAFLWTLLLFVAIQQIESNVIMPVVQKRMVHLPPALTLVSVVAFGSIFGLPGAVLSAPLTVVAFVLVKKLYVRETLGEKTDVPGEEEIA